MPRALRRVENTPIDDRFTYSESSEKDKAPESGTRLSESAKRQAGEMKKFSEEQRAKIRQEQQSFVAHANQSIEYAKNAGAQLNDVLKQKFADASVESQKQYLLQLAEYQNNLLVREKSLPETAETVATKDEITQSIEHIKQSIEKADEYLKDRINRIWGLEKKKEIPDNIPAFSDIRSPKTEAAEKTKNLWAPKPKEEPKQNFISKFFSNLFLAKDERVHRVVEKRSFFSNPFKR